MTLPRLPKKENENKIPTVKIAIFALNPIRYLCIKCENHVNYPRNCVTPNTINGNIFGM